MNLKDIDLSIDENIEYLNERLSNSNINELIDDLIILIDNNKLTDDIICKLDYCSIDFYSVICMHPDIEKKSKVISFFHSLNISIALLDNPKQFKKYNDELLELEKKALNKGIQNFAENFVYMTDDIKDIFYNIVNKYTKKIPDKLDPIFSDYMLYLRIPEFRKKFEIIFSKCHFDITLPPEPIVNLTIEQLKKFNLKKFNEISKYIMPDFYGVLEFIYFFDLFENDKNYRKIIEILNMLMYSFNENDIEDFDDFEPVRVVMYEQRRNVIEPVSITKIAEPLMSEEYFKLLKREKGTFGKEINAYLSPYAFKNDKYILKRNVDPYEGLKNELTIDEYNEILNGNDINKLAFINPYKKIEYKRYMLVKNKEKYNDKLLQRKYNNTSLVSTLFTGKDVKKSFARFILDNFTLFLQDDYLRNMFYKYQKTHDNATSFLEIAKSYYTADYNANFGFDEFAKQCRKAGVDEENYEAYEELYKLTYNRTETCVPDFYNTYFVNNEEYIVMTLPYNSPLNLLIGEKCFTDCCQVVDNAGESCMTHASITDNGAILLIGQKINDSLKILSQSWIWINNNVLCVDNVECSKTLKQRSSSYDEKIIYLLINKYGKDVAEYSRHFINNYAIDEIENSKSDIDKLYTIKNILEYQKIDTVIIGNNYSYIKELVKINNEKVDFRILPKGYPSDLYTDTYDAEKEKIEAYYIVKNDYKKDEEYDEIPIYYNDENDYIKIGSEITNLDMYKICKSLFEKDINNEEEFISLIGYKKENIIFYNLGNWFYILDLNYNILYKHGATDYIYDQIKDIDEKVINNIKEKVLYK